MIVRVIIGRYTYRVTLDATPPRVEAQCFSKNFTRTGKQHWRTVKPAKRFGGGLGSYDRAVQAAQARLERSKKEMQ